MSRLALPSSIGRTGTTKVSAQLNSATAQGGDQRRQDEAEDVEEEDDSDEENDSSDEDDEEYEDDEDDEEVDITFPATEAQQSTNAPAPAPANGVDLWGPTFPKPASAANTSTGGSPQRSASASSSSTATPDPVASGQSQPVTAKKKGEHQHVPLEQAQEARDFQYGNTFTPALAQTKLDGHRRLELEGKTDDWQVVKNNFHDYCKRLFDAIRQPWAPPPNDFKPEHKEHYTQGQTNASVDVNNRFCTVQECEWAKAQVVAVMQLIVQTHERGGIPALYFWRHQKFNKMAPEAELTCSERAEKVISVVASNKLISLSLLDGEHVKNTVYSPAGTLERKLNNAKTNRKKKERLDSAAPEVKPPKQKKGKKAMPKPKPQRKQTKAADSSPPRPASITPPSVASAVAAMPTQPAPTGTTQLQHVRNTTSNFPVGGNYFFVPSTPPLAASKKQGRENDAPALQDARAKYRRINPEGQKVAAGNDRTEQAYHNGGQTAMQPLQKSVEGSLGPDSRGDQTTQRGPSKTSNTASHHHNPVITEAPRFLSSAYTQQQMQFTPAQQFRGQNGPQHSKVRVTPSAAQSRYVMPEVRPGSALSRQAPQFDADQVPGGYLTASLRDTMIPQTPEAIGAMIQGQILHQQARFAPPKVSQGQQRHRRPQSQHGLMPMGPPPSAPHHHIGHHNGYARNTATEYQLQPGSSVGSFNNFESFPVQQSTAPHFEGVPASHAQQSVNEGCTGASSVPLFDELISEPITGSINFGDLVDENGNLDLDAVLREFGNNGAGGSDMGGGEQYGL